MSDTREHRPIEKSTGVSRRNFLGLLTLGGSAALLAACQAQPAAAPAKPAEAPAKAAEAAKPAAASKPAEAAKPAAQAAPAKAAAGVVDGVVTRTQGEPVDAYIARLYEAAQKEGSISYYHSANKEEMEAIITNWNKLFPKVRFIETQATSGTILERALTEARANRVNADVYGGSAGDQAILSSAGALGMYQPANEEFIDPAYKFPGEPYIATGYLSFHLTYNTNLTSDAEVPSNWEAFTDPKWKGKLAIDQEGFEWFAGVVGRMGEQKGLEFMRKLADQDVRLVRGSTLRTELLAAGEFPVALDLYGHRIKDFMAKGQPIAAKVPHPDPLPTVIDMASMMKQAPHPNAARLALEFFLMPEGQAVFLMQNKPGVRVQGVEHPYPNLIKDAKFQVLGPNNTDFEKAQRQFRDIFLRGR